MSTSSTEPDTALVVIGAEPADTSFREHLHQMRRHWQPPDIWNHGAPSLRESWEWAIRGEHLPDDETVRLGSRIVTGLLLPFQGAALYLVWITQRGSRLLAAAVLVTLLMLAL